MAKYIKVKMSEFAEATQVNNADDIIILQNGENKKVKSPVLESKLITRTVEELSKDGGVALNLVNLKGVVTTYADLPTTNLQINDAYQVATDGLVYIWNGTSFQDDGQGFKVQPNVIGIVEEGNTNAVSGGDVYDSTIKPSDLMFDDEYLDYSSYIVTGIGYDSSGSEVASTSQSSVIKNLPLDVINNNRITISNVTASSLRKFFFVNDLGVIVGSVYDLTSVPITRNIPSGATKLCCTLKRVTDALTPDLKINYGDLITVKAIKAIKGYEIESSKLSKDNVTPNPTSDSNAVNLGYFNINGLKEGDLETEDISTSNKLNRAYIVIGKYIDSSGDVLTSTSVNHIIENHPIYEFADEFVTFDGFIPASQKKLVFRDEFGVKIGSVIDVSVLPLTVKVPVLAFTFDLSIKRGGEDVSSYEFLRLNIGTQSLPFEPFSKTVIKSIKGYSIEGGSGEAYDQSLNTTDDVEFNSVKTNILTYTAISLDLPQGNGTPPAYVEIGDAWVDTSDSSIKVKLS